MKGVSYYRGWPKQNPVSYRDYPRAMRNFYKTNSDSKNLNIMNFLITNTSHHSLIRQIFSRSLEIRLIEVQLHKNYQILRVGVTKLGEKWKGAHSSSLWPIQWDHWLAHEKFGFLATLMIQHIRTITNLDYWMLLKIEIECGRNLNFHCPIQVFC